MLIFFLRFGSFRPAAFGAVLACVALLARAGADDETPAVVVPRFTHPGAGQTFYFVLPDRFANGSTANDGGSLLASDPASGFDPTRLTHFHGGDFVGLTARLDYLQRLGMTAVWVTPPIRNRAVQSRRDGHASTGYHGYWGLDFLHIDPHLGTDAEFQRFVDAAHARGLRVYMDIVVNHTADVIDYAEPPDYIDTTAAPYRDANGRPFDIRAAADNGLGDPAAFPTPSVERSFPHRPIIPPGWQHAKNPDWLNDPTLYHNRGNLSRTAPESAIYSDFRGLDGIMTEHPRVVRGFIDVFRHWVEDVGVDGFRIDTAKHVNAEFWQAFAPAMRASARARGRPEFLEFGEVVGQGGDQEYLSGFSVAWPLDATLDFGFFGAARAYVSQSGNAAALAAFFARDDFYTDHDSNVHSATTFLGNHDNGRFGFFLQRDNPAAPPVLLAELTKFAHGLLLLARGQPVLYYGDEQGMIGRGGDHDHAREDMFAAQADEFKTATLLGTARTGADDKFDEQHPFYRCIAQLSRLRAAHRALRTGAMFVRAADAANVFAFSRIDHDERVEYVVAFNNSRVETVTARMPTSQPGRAKLAAVFDSASDTVGSELVLDADGVAHVTLAPLQFAVWRAERPLAAPASTPRIALSAPTPGAPLVNGSREIEGTVFPLRQEVRAEVEDGDGVAEVTFALERASRPGQFELLGTDDAPPYRVFWQPPPDIASGEEITFVATASDLRGHTAAVRSSPFKWSGSPPPGSIRGAQVPRLATPLPTALELASQDALALTADFAGTAPLEFQWLRDGEPIAGATSATLRLAPTEARAGRYAVVAHNLAGSTVSAPVRVQRR
ncbi:MAG: alpha-amylase [Opitutae bacterium]|nr:alpha-amylase [Opitutae bacterium]